MPFDGALSPRAAARPPDIARPPSPAMRRSRADQEAIAVLTRARQLISEERHWCRGMFARAWFFLPVGPKSKAAHRYCALGAIMRAGHEFGLPVDRASAALTRQTGSLIPDWNDSPRRSHPEVLAAFDAALSDLGAA